MTSALPGSRILVTRPAGQADVLCKIIEQSGGKALHLPTLEIIANAPEPQSLQCALNADWLIFTSTNAVDFALSAFSGTMPGTNQPCIAAVGAATAKSLRLAGWPVDCVPVHDYSSEGLLAEPQLADVTGKTCIIVRGVGGREKLAAALRSRGAVVGYLEVYSRQRPTADIRPLTDSLMECQLDAVTVTSVEALHNLLAMLDNRLADLLRALPLIVMSDRIAQTAEQLGFKQIIASRQPTDTAILETLTTLFNGEHSGRIN